MYIYIDLNVDTLVYIYIDFNVDMIDTHAHLKPLCVTPEQFLTRLSAESPCREGIS